MIVGLKIKGRKGISQRHWNKQIGKIILLTLTIDKEDNVLPNENLWIQNVFVVSEVMNDTWNK